ncbi:MAG: glutaminyl-peptide cyclotransferase [Oscillochloris sp.]|nr:glutaminyl-peptide cyclotransferase [Oscillochloris sp.]
MAIRPNSFVWIAALALATLLFCGCASAPSSAASEVRLPTPITAPPIATAPPAPAQSAPVRYSYQVLNRYPHDTSAWTEGLVYLGDDTLYESTGDYASSSLREVRLSTGQVLHTVGLGNPVDPMLYGEGISPVGDTVFMLTWQNCLGLLYHRANFTQYGQFSFPRSGTNCAMEGWGLTYDGSQLIMSDGTNTLSFIDPAATIQSGQLAITRQVQVLDGQGNPVRNLNELEYINGSVFANVWMTNQIVQIDPTTGYVIGQIDLSGLLTPTEQASANWLNGIAYDTPGDRLFVTGKYWPALFEITLVPPISYQLNLPLVLKG